MWCESPKVVLVQNFFKAVTLYCMPSTHAGSQYKWARIDGKAKFPSTPVVYINEGGVYQCTIIFRKGQW